MRITCLSWTACAPADDIAIIFECQTMNTASRHRDDITQPDWHVRLAIVTIGATSTPTDHRTVSSQCQTVDASTIHSDCVGQIRRYLRLPVVAFPPCPESS